MLIRIPYPDVATPVYDTDAQNYFAAMTVQPNATRKGLINDLIVGLKSDGVWAKLDWLTLMAAHDAQAGRLNARAPSKVASAVNSPVFTTDRGFTGDGSASYIDVGEPWAVTGSNFGQDSASLFVWCNLASATGIFGQIGNTGAARSGINVRQGTGNNTFLVNDTTATAYTASGISTGFRSANRADANTKRAYTNGSLITTATVTSTGVSATNGSVLRGTASYTNARLAAFGSGANLTDGENTALYNRLNTFLTAIGAN